MNRIRNTIVIASLLALLACSPQTDDDGVPEAKDKAGRHDTAAAAPGDCIGEIPKEPVMCTADWRPVCGCDGKTYSNACNAKAAGVTRWEAGECADRARQDK